MSSSNEKYYSWVGATLERDNYKCQECSSTDKSRLLVHHIDNSRKSGKLNNELNNLITLCYRDHAKVHGYTKSKRNKQLYKDYQSGKFRNWELIAKYNISNARLYQIIEVESSRSDKNFRIRENVKELREMGLNLQEIAKRLDLTRQRVMQLL